MSDKDEIISIIAWFLWALALTLFVLIGIHSGWLIAVGALLPLLSIIDLMVWFAGTLGNIPCGFTEWVCYPGWPLPCCKAGCHMKWGVLIRMVEIILLLCTNVWLWKVVKSTMAQVLGAN